MGYRTFSCKHYQFSKIFHHLKINLKVRARRKHQIETTTQNIGHDYDKRVSESDQLRRFLRWFQTQTIYQTLQNIQNHC